MVIEPFNLALEVLKSRFKTYKGRAQIEIFDRIWIFWPNIFLTRDCASSRVPEGKSKNEKVSLKPVL